MIEKLSYYIRKDFDPYTGLAVERYLTESAGPDECILYLWQNRNTVVIGYNQNVWKECRTRELAEAGGIAVRRMSGGGAVFHDLGNLNFTFCLTEENYDQPKQQRVLLEACRLLGIDAELSGRNDLTANGCKFSGNSFYHRNGRAFHNGTLLIDVDMEGLGRFLSPSKAKLRSKSVDSVRSRVINLKELRPDLTIDMMKQALIEAFEKVYGLKAEEKLFCREDLEKIEAYRAGFADPDWTFAAARPFDISFGEKFSWGELYLELKIEEGRIAHAGVWTDSLDTEFAEPLAAALEDRRLEAGDITDALKSCPECSAYAEDIIGLIMDQAL